MPSPARSRFRRTVAALLVGASLAGCGDEGGSTAPDGDGVAESALTFLRPAADAPPLAATTASFYARRGSDRLLALYYQRRAGATDSSEFLEFRVAAEALARRPDGSAVAIGDSVLITVTVDPARLKVTFAPAGLRFSASKPARLKLRFAEADDDRDGDGDVDAGDAAATTKLGIWRQESPGQPWFRESSVLLADVDEVDADILGFTAYAIAF